MYNKYILNNYNVYIDERNYIILNDVYFTEVEIKQYYFFGMFFYYKKYYCLIENEEMIKPNHIIKINKIKILVKNIIDLKDINDNVLYKIVLEVEEIGKHNIVKKENIPGKINRNNDEIVKKIINYQDNEIFLENFPYQVVNNVVYFDTIYCNNIKFEDNLVTFRLCFNSGKCYKIKKIRIFIKNINDVLSVPWSDFEQCTYYGECYLSKKEHLIFLNTLKKNTL